MAQLGEQLTSICSFLVCLHSYIWSWAKVLNFKAGGPLMQFIPSGSKMHSAIHPHTLSVSQGMTTDFSGTSQAHHSWLYLYPAGHQTLPRACNVSLLSGKDQRATDTICQISLPVCVLCIPTDWNHWPDPVSQRQQTHRLCAPPPPNPSSQAFFDSHLFPLSLVSLLSCQLVVRGQWLWARCLLGQLPQDLHADDTCCRCGLLVLAQLQMSGNTIKYDQIFLFLHSLPFMSSILFPSAQVPFIIFLKNISLE